MAPDPSLLSDDAKHIWNEMVKQVKSRKIDIPLLPDVANNVISLSQDVESDSQQLTQLIQSDPSLAAHVMRIANSAAYTPTTSLVSLQQAITRLGMNLICDIAVAASISTKMFNTPGYEARIADIWKHALATALWAKEIARICRLNVEATFLCGLLHSIGRPIAIQDVLELAANQPCLLTPEEVQTMEDGLHLVIGSHVLKKWEMPLIICESHKYFDNYRDAPHAMEQTAIVNAAASFAQHMLAPDTLTLETLQNIEVLEDLNLYPDEVQELLDQSDNIRSSIEAMSNQ